MGMENVIKFADQVTIPVDEVQTMGWGKELVNATVDFANKLVELNLDLTEFCILNAIVLTYPGRLSVCHYWRTKFGVPTCGCRDLGIKEIQKHFDLSAIIFLCLPVSVCVSLSVSLTFSPSLCLNHFSLICAMNIHVFPNME